MWSYVLRRLLIAVLVIFAASFLVYVLAANSGDPLENLRGSTAPNKEALIAAATQRLHLDVPPPLRYFIWLGGVLKLFVGQIDLGTSIEGVAVTTLLSQSMWSTLQLVTIATFLAIFVGVAIGMVSALRQYSGFDYAVTFVAFLFFALPTFWVGQFLKLNVAVAFNDFLENPIITPLWMILLSLILAFIWASAMGGQLKKWSINFAGAFVIGLGILIYVQLTDFFETPSLGPIWIAIIGAAAAVVVTELSTGLSNRKALYASFTAVAITLVAWWPAQYLFFYMPQWWAVFGLGIVIVGLSAVGAWLWGGDDRPVSVRSAVITAVIGSFLIFVDYVMGSWPDYLANTGGRPIATIGSSTAGLEGSIWLQTVDSFTHLLLPTLTIMLISLASYSRYSRASLLEVMQMDYVRTARAKGLNERTVVMRHAFRNALIPLATIVAFDLGGLIGGAVITETVFSWQGMGRLFVTALRAVDLNTIMGIFLVTSVFALIFNLLADITYSVLDPRIRLN
jgi:peptide/nickel transport system permease protein